LFVFFFHLISVRFGPLKVVHIEFIRRISKILPPKSVRQIDRLRSF
jgi:hypothetical protein